jgi:hypothetical protein
MGHGTNETSYGSASAEAVGDNHGLDHPRYGDSPSVHTHLCVLHCTYVTHLYITVCSVSILIIITYITLYVCSVTIFRFIITYITHYVCSVTIFRLIITYITLYVCSVTIFELVIITYITLYVCSVI